MISSLPVSDIDLMGALVLFFALAIGHAIADFPLQGEFLSRGKNRHLPPPPLADGDSSPRRLWIYLMSAHTLTHAGFVWVITGSALLAFAEFVIHFLIDSLKCERWTGFETDQWLHIATKVVYVIVIWCGLV
jgi:hypothetical protein